jgi:hypothetical protein
MKKCGSSKSNFLKFRTGIVIIIFCYPYLVGFSTDSTTTSGTVIDLLLGAGRHAHATYDCSGNLMQLDKYYSYDYGASVYHKGESDFKFGARGGGYKGGSLGYSDPQITNSSLTEEGSVQFINPFLGYDGKYFEANIGLVFFTRSLFEDDHKEDINFYMTSFYMNSKKNIIKYLFFRAKIQPSWILRIGNREKFHFSTQYLSNIPIFSGGGIMDIGFGFGSQESRNLTWIGTSAGPYEKFGLNLKQTIQLSEKTDFLFRGRAGTNENSFEGGISAGIRMFL